MPYTIGKCKLFRIEPTTFLEGETFLRSKDKIAIFEIKCTFFGRKENTINKIAMKSFSTNLSFGIDFKLQVPSLVYVCEIYIVNCESETLIMPYRQCSFFHSNCLHNLQQTVFATYKVNTGTICVVTETEILIDHGKLQTIRGYTRRLCRCRLIKL